MLRVAHARSRPYAALRFTVRAGSLVGRSCEAAVRKTPPASGCPNRAGPTRGEWPSCGRTDSWKAPVFGNLDADAAEDLDLPALISSPKAAIRAPTRIVREKPRKISPPVHSGVVSIDRLHAFVWSRSRRTNTWKRSNVPLTGGVTRASPSRRTQETPSAP